MSDTDVVPMDALSLGAAQRIADAAIASAQSHGIAVCIAICDPAGEPIVTIRMDGAPRLSAGVALNKAFTVASFKGMPTHAWWPLLADDPALVHGFTHTPRLVIFAGGVPVRRCEGRRRRRRVGRFFRRGSRHRRSRCCRSGLEPVRPVTSSSLGFKR